MSALNILVKGLSVVLIGMLGAKWAIIYIAADIGLFLVIKIARGDFYYWIPLDGWASIVFSLVMRVMAKVIVDFTSIGEIMHVEQSEIMRCTQITPLLLNFPSVVINSPLQTCK